MAFTEFYAQSGGSNLNAGSTTNNTAVYTTTNGNWSTVTNVFTPTDASTPSDFVSVGDFVSIYLDAATVSVFIARVTNVAPGLNGAITVSATVRAGTPPATGSTGRSLKSGGAWLGPNGTSGFPISLGSLANLLNVSSDPVRVNLKNDATYSISAVINQGTGSTKNLTFQGYSSSPGDGGRCIIDGGTNNIELIDTSNAGTSWIDLEFASSATTGTNTLIVSGNQSQFFYRCIFHGSRGGGLSAGCQVVECEAYNCNRSNTAAIGALTFLSTAYVVRCYAHDNPGSNGNGFKSQGQGAFIQCISESNGGSGLLTASGSNITVNQCDFYNNGGDGIHLDAASTNVIHIESCNFIKNAGAGINNSTGQNGYIYNCAYGSGTQANGSADVLGTMLKFNTVTYENDVTPYNHPVTGDFSLVPTDTTLMLGAGRGNFTETDGTNSGTVGYPDIGAAQHNPELLDEGIAGIGGA